MPVDSNAGMSTHERCSRRFYEAFSRRDAGAMAACDHPDVEFSDPVFPKLVGDDARAMWAMLCAGGKDLRLELGEVLVEGERGSAEWTARYTFSGTRRPVVNQVRVSFEPEEPLKHLYWIAFDSNRAGGNRDLYVMRPDGSELRRLTEDDWTESEPVFSPGGMRLAFHRSIGIYTIDLGGTDERHVVDGLDALNPYQHPRYLPGGGWLLMSRGNSIERIRTDGTDREQVVEYAATTIYMPSPSPSGASVAFAAYCIDGFSIRSAPTGSVTSPCSEDTEMHFPGTRPAWGPDRLAFETDEPNRDILVLTPPNGAARNLTAHPADDRNAAWSPAHTIIP